MRFFTGKWVKLDLFYVPLPYFKHLLSITCCIPYNFKETTHLRQPIFTDNTLRVSYRTEDVDNVLTALQEQSREQVITRRVHGQGPEYEGMNADDALALAKSRAQTSYTLRSRTVTEIDISEKREFEMIWWPNLYSKNGHGKLTLRLFIQT